MTGNKQKKQNKQQAKQVKAAVKQQVHNLGKRGVGRGAVDDATLTIVSKAKKLAKMHGHEVASYALCLHDPEIYKARFPDPYPRRSALYQSVQEFDVPISFGFSNNEVNGRFAIALRPILGDIRDFSRYRAYVPKSSALGWDTGVFTADDFTPASAAADPRQDPEIGRLIGTVPSVTAYHTFATTDTSEVLIGDRWDPVLAIRRDQWNTTFDNTGVEIVKLIEAPGVAPTSAFNFPPTSGPMEYRISLVGSLGVAGNAAFWSVAHAIDTLVGGGDVTINDVTGYLPTHAQTIPINAGVGDGTYRQVLGRVISVTVGVGGGQLLLRGSTDVGTWLESSGVVGLFASPNTKRIRISILGFPSIQLNSNFGLVKNLRPVGTSLLLKWVGPLIENAGKISAALAPIGTFGDEIFRPTSQTFNPFFYEAYQRLNNGNDGVSVMHTSRLDRGAYVSYLPQSVQNTEFKSYDEMNSADWPLLCVAGQYFKASSPLTGGEGIFLRGRIVTVYEYTTNSSIPEVATLSRAIPLAVPTAYNILSDLEIPCVMENDIHSVYTKLLEGLQKVLNDAAYTVGSTAGSLIGGFKAKSGTLPKLGLGPQGLTLSLANS